MIQVRVHATPCEGCLAPCCVDRPVMLGANDLWRVCRAMSLPWRDVATVGVAFGDGFRLDGGPTRWGLRLRQRRTGACIFLVQPEGGHARCGVHPVRPAACRIYPYHVAVHPQGVAVAIGGNAACPAPLAHAFRLRVVEDQGAIYEELAERSLYLAAIERWDAAVMRAVRPVEGEAFVEWAFLMYDKIEPLRGRALTWREEAVALIRASTVEVA